MEPQAPTGLFWWAYSLKRLEKIFVNDLNQNLECSGDFYLIENHATPEKRYVSNYFGLYVFDLKSTELSHNIYIEGVISTLNVAHRLIRASKVLLSILFNCLPFLD